MNVEKTIFEFSRQNAEIHNYVFDFSKFFLIFKIEVFDKNSTFALVCSLDDHPRSHLQYIILMSKISVTASVSVSLKVSIYIPRSHLH